MEELDEYAKKVFIRDNHLTVDDYDDLIQAVLALWGTVEGAELLIKLQNLREAEMIR